MVTIDSKSDNARMRKAFDVLNEEVPQCKHNDEFKLHFHKGFPRICRDVLANEEVKLSEMSAHAAKQVYKFPHKKMIAGVNNFRTALMPIGGLTKSIQERHKIWSESLGGDSPTNFAKRRGVKSIYAFGESLEYLMMAQIGEASTLKSDERLGLNALQVIHGSYACKDNEETLRNYYRTELEKQPLQKIDRINSFRRVLGYRSNRDPMPMHFKVLQDMEDEENQFQEILDNLGELYAPLEGGARAEVSTALPAAAARHDESEWARQEETAGERLPHLIGGPGVVFDPDIIAGTADIYGADDQRLLQISSPQRAIHENSSEQSRPPKRAASVAFSSSPTSAIELEGVERSAEQARPVRKAAQEANVAPTLRRSTRVSVQPKGTLGTLSHARPSGSDAKEKTPGRGRGSGKS